MLYTDDKLNPDAAEMYAALLASPPQIELPPAKEIGECLSPYASDDCPDTPIESSCSHCFCWRACNSSDCDHPACESDRWRRWHDVWKLRNPEDADHRIWTSDGVPLLEHARFDEIIEEITGGKATTVRHTPEHLQKLKDKGVHLKVHKALDLARKSREDGWLDLYDIRGVQATDYTDALILLHFEGVKLEGRNARWLHQSALEHSAWKGDELPRGGCWKSEYRLPPLADLGSAPAGAQGALF